MAIRSGFFMSVNGDRRYKADFFAEYFASFIGNGVFPNPSTGYQVIADNNNLTITLKPGKAWINGYYAVNDNDYTMELDRADGVLNRIDRIVLRLDYLNREIIPFVKKGNFVSSPVAPSLQRDADFYELGIADIYVSRGATAITQANITDLRLNGELCGIVSQTVKSVDTTTLYNQYLDFWNDWRTGKIDEFEQFQTDSQDAFDNQTLMNQDTFDNWLESIQGILNDDVAGNLLGMIEDVINSKGQPGGIPELDDEGKVPTEQLPDMDYVPTSEKGAPGGVATLDGSGNVIYSQLGNVNEGALYAIGSYAGNATITTADTPTSWRTINLGFRPKMVWFNGERFNDNNQKVIENGSGEGETVLELTSNGLRVRSYTDKYGYLNAYGANNPDRSYEYEVLG